MASTCDVRYVSSLIGTDTNTGCNASMPLLTIAACVSLVGSGSSCLLMPGTYRESSAFIQGVTNLTIALAPAELWPHGEVATTATLDGTMDLLNWEQRSDAYGIYYRSTQSHGIGDNGTVHQLFVDGEPLTAARWPNALAWTDEWWDPWRGWARQGAGTVCGHSEDAGTAQPAVSEAGHQSLAATGVSFDGCNLILNNEHWITRRYEVQNHTAGTPSLNYTTKPGNSLCDKYASDTTNNAYFIDGCVAAFDAPGEWVSDADGHLLVRLPAGLASQGIGSVTVTGKAQTYALAFDACDGLTLRDISFFATTVLLYESPDATIEGCTFDFPSASRRSLGFAASEFDAEGAFGIHPVSATLGLSPDRASFDVEVPSTWIGKRPWLLPDGTRTVVRGNTVRRTEGAAFYCSRCSHDLFEQNVVEQAGHPFARAAFGFGGVATHYVTLRRNTCETDGTGCIGQLWGEGNIAEYNRVSDSGLLVVDNQGIGGGKPTTHTVYRFNWVHDSRGLGLRFDAGEDGRFGEFNELQYNVVVRNNQGGLSGKADRASNYRNTAVDNQGGTDVESMSSGADMKICACYPANCEGEFNGSPCPPSPTTAR